MLGTPPPPPQPGDFVDPFMDALVVRLLGITPPDDEPDPNLIDGVAGSPGVYTGVARVVRSLSEAGDLEDGEVMVCEMTLPPWVPMFSIAGAVVSDVGGVMSHCAIVAREFDVPAVVGSLVGTTRHPDRSDGHRRRHQRQRLARRPLPRLSGLASAARVVAFGRLDREIAGESGVGTLGRHEPSQSRGYFQSCLVASSAPCARCVNLGHTTVGWTSGV